MAIITVTNTCPFCGKLHSVEVNDLDFYLWSNGITLIQEAFPYLSADEREIVKTGICPDCWNNLFSCEESKDDLEELEDDWEESDDWPDWEEGWDEDMGFDPYLGCYSNDC